VRCGHRLKALQWVRVRKAGRRVFVIGRSWRPGRVAGGEGARAPGCRREMACSTGSRRRCCSGAGEPELAARRERHARIGATPAARARRSGHAAGGRPPEDDSLSPIPHL